MCPLLAMQVFFVPFAFGGFGGQNQGSQLFVNIYVGGLVSVVNIYFFKFKPYNFYI